MSSINVQVRSIFPFYLLFNCRCKIFLLLQYPLQERQILSFKAGKLIMFCSLISL